MAGCERPAIAAFVGEDCSDPDVLAEASPISHVDGDHPPTQLFHGTEDELLGVSQSRAYRDALGQRACR
jgi:dipeptidyl aminopeptidase/acylaminoacyl peptidase